MQCRIRTARSPLLVVFCRTVCSQMPSRSCPSLCTRAATKRMAGIRAYAPLRGRGCFRSSPTAPRVTSAHPLCGSPCMASTGGVMGGWCRG
eukprot:1160690-Pelagomonas_calceolata.AAC.19